MAGAADLRDLPRRILAFTQQLCRPFCVEVLAFETAPKLRPPLRPRAGRRWSIRGSDRFRTRPAPQNFWDTGWPNGLVVSTGSLGLGAAAESNWIAAASQLQFAYPVTGRPPTRWRRAPGAPPFSRLVPRSNLNTNQASCTRSDLETSTVRYDKKYQPRPEEEAPPCERQNHCESKNGEPRTALASDVSYEIRSLNSKCSPASLHPGPVKRRRTWLPRSLGAGI